MMTRKKMRWIKLSIFALLAIATVSATAFLYYHHLERQAARVPASIREELVFSPFIVTLDNNAYEATDYKLSEVDKGVQLLSFVVRFDNKSVTVSEYVQPPEFTEIPEFRQRFLDNAIKQYATVQTANGTIYLGKQVRQNDRQLGIMLERGLIVMFNPEQELTQAEWRRLGDQFDIQKISN
jgi:hypothetical protein